ncbi:MAG: hypothetical protein KJ069_27670 [Anaerolineae bacterium]|nr:hypothetical protein [Anaerolineae bacterium]
MNQEYRQFTLWTCSIGFIFGIVAMFVIMAIGLFLPSAMDGAIALALFIPDKLGLVTQGTGEDNVLIGGGSGTYIISLPYEGTYYIYSPRLIADNTKLRLVSTESGNIIEVTSATIINNNNPFPQRIDVEDPQFIFDVEAAGQYHLHVESTGPDLSMSIVPYFGGRNTNIAMVSGAIQIMLVVFGARLLYRYLNRDRLQRQKAVADKKRERLTTFLDKEKSRQAEEEQREV